MRGTVPKKIHDILREAGDVMSSDMGSPRKNQGDHGWKHRSYCETFSSYHSSSDSDVVLVYSTHEACRKEASDTLQALLVVFSVLLCLRLAWLYYRGRRRNSEFRARAHELFGMVTAVETSPQGPEVLCPICLTGKRDATWCRIYCGHLFHKECLDQWFEHSGTCPMCRSLVFVREE